jgi:hypothetical protein
LLQAAALASKNAFFTLLDKKAFFLMLPRLIIVALKGSVRVKLSEEPSKDPQAVADTIELDDPRQAQMHIPGATEGLAEAGYDLGRLTFDKGFPEDEPSDLYNMVATIYHELTHAWLWLHQFYDDDFQTLWANGVVAYLNAKGEDGKELDPSSAFTEAAAYYVEDRINRWSLVPRYRDRQRLACGCPKFDDVCAVSLRAKDHDSIFASLRHRHFFLPQSSSASRVTAVAFGFFILSQSGERPER